MTFYFRNIVLCVLDPTLKRLRIGNPEKQVPINSVSVDGNDRLRDQPLPGLWAIVFKCQLGASKSS